MPSNNQIIEAQITDAINTFHNSDYKNPIAAAQVFGLYTKTIYQKLDGRASKSLRLLSNKVLNLEHEHILTDFI